jgi:hypothetical protein
MDVACHWYLKAFDKASATSTRYHHTVIADEHKRIASLQQLFYYAKILCFLGIQSV